MRADYLLQALALSTVWITIGLLGGCAGSSRGAVTPASEPPLLRPPPDSIAVVGRQLWFSADAGMGGPNPVIVFRAQDTTVAGEVLVWYADTEGGRSAKVRYDHLCDSHQWHSGALGSLPIRFCRVPLGPKAPKWAAALGRVDSLLDHRPAERLEQSRQRVIMSCSDQEGWWIAEAEGHRRTMHRLIEIGDGCPATDSVAAAYNAAGFRLFRGLLDQAERGAMSASGDQ